MSITHDGSVSANRVTRLAILQAALAARPTHACGGMGKPLSSNFDRTWFNCDACGKDFRRQEPK